MVDDDGDLPNHDPADVVDNLHAILAQEALWETGGGSFFKAGNRSIIVTALEQLSKTVSS